MSEIISTCQENDFKIQLANSLKGIVPQYINNVPHIFYHLDERYLTSDMGKFEQILMVQKSFDVLQPLLPGIVLTTTSNINKAAIVIKFMRNGHPQLPQSFERGVLAYAYFPSGESLGVHSDIFMSDEHDWTDGWKSRGFDGRQVLSHEAGHSFGLDHEEGNNNSLMFWQIIRGKGFITEWIKDSFTKLYGQLAPKKEPPTKNDLPDKDVADTDSDLCRKLFGAARRHPTHVARMGRPLLRFACRELGVKIEGRVTRRKMAKAILERVQEHE